MAGKKNDARTGQKVSFGVRRNGKAKKSSGPKDKPVKEYRGQGR